MVDRLLIWKQLDRNACKRIEITHKLLVKLNSLPPKGQPLTKPHKQTTPLNRQTRTGTITNPPTPPEPTLPTNLGRRRHHQLGYHLLTPHHSPITHNTLTPLLPPQPIPFPRFPLPTMLTQIPLMIRLGQLMNGPFGNHKTGTLSTGNQMHHGTLAHLGATCNPFSRLLSMTPVLNFSKTKSLILITA